MNQIVRTLLEHCSNILKRQYNITYIKNEVDSSIYFKSVCDEKF